MTNKYEQLQCMLLLLIDVNEFLETAIKLFLFKQSFLCLL